MCVVVVSEEGDSNTPASFASRICIACSDSKLSKDSTRNISTNEAMQGPELNVVEWLSVCLVLPPPTASCTTK